MKKLANLIVNKRHIVMSVMLLLAIVSVFLMQKVTINDDMTKYLADDSPMKIGMDIMEEEFPEMETSQTIRVMFQDLNSEQKMELLTELKDIKYVDTVDYDIDSEDYNKDNHTLYILNTSYAYGSDEEISIETALDENFNQYDMIYRNGDTSIGALPTWIICLAFAILMIILFIMCNSWIEPFLFLVTIGVAIVINMGTNIVMGSVSNITFSIAAILQLVLSMDYSIILMNRYRQEKQLTDVKEDAMKKALVHAFSSITGSSLTTIVGLLALVFMSFKIGMDLGIVLAKGVLISMLCIFTVLPFLILISDKLIQKTTKKVLEIPMNKVAAFSYRFRHVLTALFVVMFIGFYILQGNTETAYTLENEDPIADIFPSSNMLVMVYDNQDEEKVAKIAEELEKDPNIKQVMGYTNTLGKDYTAKELVDVIDELGSDMNLDSSLINILYYNYFADGKLLPMTASDFLKFISDDVMKNEAFADYFDKDMKENAEMTQKFSDVDSLTKPMNAEELADFFDMDTDNIEQLFLLYQMKNDKTATVSMTLPTFANFVVNEVASKEEYSSMFDNETLSKMEMLKTFTDTKKMTTPYRYKEIANLLGMDKDSVELLFVYYYALSDSYTPGTMTLKSFVKFVQNDVASNSAFASYFDKETLAQMEMLSEYTNKDTIQKQMSSSELAKFFGMDEKLIQQIFMLHFGSDTEGKTMTLPTFTDFLVNSVINNGDYAGYFDEDTKTQVITLNQMITLVTSGQELSTEQLAQSIGMDEGLVQQIFTLYFGNEIDGKTITLSTFMDFLVNSVLNDENYSGYFDEATKAQVIGINQMITVALSGQEMTATQLAEIMGIDANMIQQIFTLYYGNDTSGKTMSPEQMVDFILSDSTVSENLDNETKQQLAFVQTIMKSSVSDTKYGYKQMANLLGMDSSMMKMLYTYYDSVHGDTSAWRLSVQTVVNFLVKNSGQLGSVIGSSDLEQLKMAQKLINGSVAGNSYSAKELANLIGMDEGQINQLYLLYTMEHGDTTKWKMSIQTFVDFIISDVLTDKTLSNQFDTDSKDMLTMAKNLIDAVVSGKTYTPAEMYQLLASVSDQLDNNTIELLYLYYASTIKSDPTWTMTIGELLDYLVDDILKDPRFATMLDADMRTEIEELDEQLNEGMKQLKGSQHSRIIISMIYSDESPETTAFLKKLTSLCDEKLTGDYYLIGNSAMTYEMQQTFDKEMLFITLLTAIAIFIVIALTFRSIIISAILVLLVQCGVYITVTIIGLQGYSIYFLALLIVECILMGATIDYGILFTNYYREKRHFMGVKEALHEAYNGSIHTIMTSGLIIVLVVGIVGNCFSNPVIGQICKTLSTGALCASLLILFILPGLLATFDKMVIRKNKEQKMIENSR